MFILRKVVKKKIEQKMVIKKRYFNNFYDKDDVFDYAKDHKHQTCQSFRFESDKIVDQTFFIKKVFMKEEKIEIYKQEKTELNILTKFNIDTKKLEIIEDIKDLEKIVSKNKKLNYFKDSSIYLNYPKKLRLSDSFSIKGIDLNKTLQVSQGIVFSNYTTSKNKSISIVEKDILDGYLRKGISLHDENHLAMVARNMKELLDMIMILNQLKDDYDQSLKIKENTHIEEIDDFMSKYNENMLKSVGLKNIEMMTFRSLKSTENYYLELLEKEKC